MTTITAHPRRPHLHVRPHEVLDSIGVVFHPDGDTDLLVATAPNVVRPSQVKRSRRIAHELEVLTGGPSAEALVSAACDLVDLLCDEHELLAQLHGPDFDPAGPIAHEALTGVCWDDPDAFAD